MIKTTLRIDGMMCGMCEAHVNDAIRARFNVKKVTSSHAKGECVILSEEALDETALRAATADYARIPNEYTIDFAALCLKCHRGRWRIGGELLFLCAAAYAIINPKSEL